MPVALACGDSIGDATIEALLGEGGFGSVFRARLPNGQLRAIKVAHEPTEAMTTQELSLLQNEIEAVLRLRHPGLVRTYGYGYLDDGRLYLVMELVDGISLIDHVDAIERLDPVEALAIVERVAEVMAYCHEQGVLHLDLKPDNIVLTDRHSSKLKVLDFGVARLSRAWRGAERVIAGTPAYMAPEAFGETPREPSMDVYALGVALHVMLTGTLAFDDAQLTAQIHDKHAGPPALDSAAWQQAPGGLRELLRAMLAPAPQDRPTMATVRTWVRRLGFSALVGGLDESVPDEVEPGPTQPVQVRRLFGRDAELAYLRERWAEAQREPVRPIFVLGPQGIGKSALLDEFLAEHDQGRVVAADGRCRESGDLVPYASIREAAGRLGETLRSLPDWRALGRRLRAALGPLEAVLLALVPEAAAEQEAPEDAAPMRPGPEVVAAAMRRLLEVVARYRPLILVLEDLQWAGGEAGEAMRLLAAEPIEGALLLMSGREAPPWADGLESIELGSLEPVDNEALLGALLDTDEPEVIEWLVGHVPALATGIPAATVQVAADLQLQRCVQRKPGGGVVLDEQRLSSYAPPATVAEVLERRLGQLEPGPRKILAVGALFGRRFEREAVVGTELFDPDDVEAAMLDAHVLGLAQVHGSTCTLAHDALVRRLEADWDPQEVRDVHARIAARMAREGIEPGRRAMHLEKAEQWGEAAQVHLEAGRNADGLHAVFGAARHFRRAIELAESIDDSERRTEVVREAVFEYARLAGATGQIEDAFSVVEVAARALGVAGDSDEHDYAVDSALARLHYVRGNMSAALEYGDHCLAGAGDTPATRRYRVLPTNLMGRALYVRGRYGEAAVALAHGCSMAASERQSTELSHSLAMLGLSLGYNGVLDEARGHLQRANAMAERGGDPIRRLAARCYAAIEAEYAYDWDLGVIRSAEALTFAQEHEIDGFYHYLSLVVAGRHQFHVGRLSRASLLLDHALAVGRQQSFSTALGWALAFAGDVALVEGRFDDAVAAYGEGLQVGEQDEYAMALNLSGRAHLHAYADRDREAHDRDVEAALARLRAVDNVAVQAHALLRQADGLVALGDEEAAVAPRHFAEQVFGRLGVPVVEWWPVPPEGPQPDCTAREYWLAEAGRSGRPMERPADEPVSEVLRRVTMTIDKEARELRELEVRPGGMKPGR